jgi:signal transduction histidine kinase
MFSLHWPDWSGTARRLVLGFGALVLVVGAASWVALAGLSGTRAALERMKDDQEGARLALDLTSAVRDQYAHQAHTIIIGDETHLGFYTEAHEHVLELTRRLRAHAAPEALALVDDIEQASAELDGLFRQKIVPAVLRGDRAFVRAEHARAQEIVTRIQDLAEQLVARSDASIAASRAEVQQMERRTHDWIVVLLVGAPLLAAVVSITIGRSIARPVARLRSGAARLAAGDLDARIDVGSADEFGALAAQFNAMTAAIKEHERRLVQSEKLAGIGRLAAGVAHEINNPLGVILGYARLLGKKAEGPLADDLRVIEEEAVRARDIVEGLLDLSRPLPPAREPLDLHAVCQEVVGRLREASVLDGVEVSIEGSGVALGHPAKLRQVVANLVRNAAEAAGPEGRVAVRVRQDAGGGLVEVQDDGPGLDAEATSRLFEPFFTTKEKGTGLGLAVSRAIARAHGGDIEAGPAPGGGSIFALRIPPPAAGEEAR